MDMSTEELQTLISDMENNFDYAITSRFDASDSQKSSMESTSDSFKTILINAMTNLYALRIDETYAEITIKGLEGSGAGMGLQTKPIKIGFGHKPDCTV